jgi:DNA-binding CsgD family transcriptional regulator
LSGQKPDKYQNTDILLPRLIVEDCSSLIAAHDRKFRFSHNRIINTKNGVRYFLKYKLIDQPCKDVTLPYFVININSLSKNNDETGMILSKDYGLSEREEKIAQCAGQGLTNKEISRKLGISIFTVQTHLRNIFEKMGIVTRTQLANLIK